MANQWTWGPKLHPVRPLPHFDKIARCSDCGHHAVVDTDGDSEGHRTVTLYCTNQHCPHTECVACGDDLADSDPTLVAWNDEGTLCEACSYTIRRDP